MDIKTLISVASGKIPHNYRSGLCPDELQPDSRDPDCPACKILTEAEAEHDEMERRLRDAEARVTVTTDESGRAVAVTRQDDEHRILSVIWEAPVTAPVRLTDRDKDDLAAPYSGMGGIEDYRAYAQDIETAALRANGFDIQPARGADGE